MHWLTIGWYAYLFGRPAWNRHYEWPGWRMIWCRSRGHPSGVVYMNPGGLEPDLHCRNCGEDLG